MNIDWSKAPEGATHFFRDHHGRLGSWWKVSSERSGPPSFVYSSFGGQWIAMAHAPCDILPIPNNKPWNGEGLPPVGHAVCEYRGAHQWDVWTIVNIFAEWGEGSRRVVFVDFGDGWREERDPERFRPIRTPEQIAAEERLRAIKQIIDDYKYVVGPCTHMITNDQAARIYDAGYRKFEIVEGE